MKSLNLGLVGLLAVPALANSAVVFDSWKTNEGITGNYIVTITDAGFVKFNFVVDVNPWNAEPLGLFIDLGAKTMSGLSTGTSNLSNVTSSPTTGVGVELFAKDTTSNDCGSGCNLQGLSPVLVNPDNEWEMVFRLGDAGFNGVSTFSWTVAGMTGIEESDFLLAGIRAQQLCAEGETLTADSAGSCEGSDKSYSSDPRFPQGEVPIPAAAWLFGSGLLGLAGIARTRRA